MSHVTCVTPLVKMTSINLDLDLWYIFKHTTMISISTKFQIPTFFYFTIGKTFVVLCHVCHIVWQLRNFDSTGLSKQFWTLPILFYCSVRVSRQNWYLSTWFHCCFCEMRVEWKLIHFYCYIFIEVYVMLCLRKML